ncbi:MAG: adenosine deaminase [Alphaproteobacteria bacterium]
MTLASFVHAMPKVELHVHMEGSISPETLLCLCERNGLAPPHDTVEGLKTLYRYDSFDDFKRVLLMHVRCLRKLDDFAFLIHRMGAEMAAQNIIYAEITWTPQFYLTPGSSPDAILEALNEGRQRARDDFGVAMAWIPDLVRSVPAPMDYVQQWACGAAARRGGVVALGLGGPEAGHPAEDFAAVFTRARDLGLPATPHAGEGAGPESVWAALKDLHASRIGHGVRAVEDPDLLRYLAESGVALEVCPTSNLHLGLYPSYDARPLKQLVAGGCRVTINTDDPALFTTGLSDEYRHAVEDCGLSIDELEDAALNAVAVSFLPDGEKSSLHTEFQADYARLRAQHGISPRP